MLIILAWLVVICGLLDCVEIELLLFFHREDDNTVGPMFTRRWLRSTSATGGTGRLCPFGTTKMSELRPQES